MIPLRDAYPTSKRPVITSLLIGINILVFMMELLSSESDGFINRYALIGARVNFLLPLSLLPFLSSQFLHASLIHLFSNLWFLKIFGDNVEDRLGHFKFLLFYLFCGVIAGLAQYFFMMRSEIPVLGASGAVAGVLGAYFVFFPNHLIETLILGPFFWHRVYLPASVMLFYWFIIQLLSAFSSLSLAALGGVAFFAHIGGFFTGWLIAKKNR